MKFGVGTDHKHIDKLCAVLTAAKGTAIEAQGLCNDVSRCNAVLV